MYTEVSNDLEQIGVDVAEIEHDLRQWELNLFPELKLKPWDAAISATSTLFDPIFERLSVIIRLRFLNTRLLVHRVTLRALSSRLENIRNGQAVETQSFSTLISEQSIKYCASSACELITIVNRMSTEPMKLGGRWFSIYYSKCTPFPMNMC